MKYYIFLLVLISISSCKKIKKDNKIVNLEYIKQEKSDTILEPNYIAVFDKKTGNKAELSKIELKILNRQLEVAVDNYNEELKIKLDEWNSEDKTKKWNYYEEKINLRYYFRQYIVSQNEMGEKIVRMFCFCSSFGVWKNEIMRVHDGGKCYLNATFNLSTNEMEYFGTNGLA